MDDVRQPDSSESQGSEVERLRRQNEAISIDRNHLRETMEQTIKERVKAEVDRTIKELTQWDDDADSVPNEVLRLRGEVWKLQQELDERE